MSQATSIDRCAPREEKVAQSCAPVKKKRTSKRRKWRLRQTSRKTRQCHGGDRHLDRAALTSIPFSTAQNKNERNFSILRSCGQSASISSPIVVHLSNRKQTWVGDSGELTRSFATTASKPSDLRQRHSRKIKSTRQIFSVQFRWTAVAKQWQFSFFRHGQTSPSIKFRSCLETGT